MQSIVQRPWGSFQILDEGEGYWVKKITVLPFARLSLQFHEHRVERWTILYGCGEITLNKNISPCRSGTTVIIGPKMIHRIHNVSDYPLVFIEVALGDPKEEDIIRLEDDWNRK